MLQPVSCWHYLATKVSLPPLTQNLAPAQPYLLQEHWTILLHISPPLSRDTAFSAPEPWAVLCWTQTASRDERMFGSHYWMSLLSPIEEWVRRTNWRADMVSQIAKSEADNAVGGGRVWVGVADYSNNRNPALIRGYADYVIWFCADILIWPLRNYNLLWFFCFRLFVLCQFVVIFIVCIKSPYV